MWVIGRANVHLSACICVCGPSVLTRLLESDKKSDWTRLKYEYRAGERERDGEGKGKELGEQRNNGLELQNFILALKYVKLVKHLVFE